jgi:4-hydroxybenzoate polyprenyltransferase
MSGSIWRALRPQQWAKNLLVLVVVGISHRYRISGDVWRAIAGALLFCPASSAVYLCNDIMDIDADRRHPVKKNRPVASGELAIPAAGVLAAVLATLALAGAWLLSPGFALTLAVYVVTSFLYSFRIKRLLMIDVVVLACLYLIRVFAGGIVIGIWLSFWTAAFSLFFFFSLALVKRYSEMRNLQEREPQALSRRAYRPADLAQLNMLGVASSLVSVLVVGLYIDGPDVRQLYSHPAILSFLCPILLGWCGRLWVLAARGVINEDPIAFALHDWPSYAAVLMMALTMAVAR